MADFFDDVVGLDPNGGGVGNVLDPFGVIRDVTGISGAAAAEEAAGRQEEAGQRAITVQEQAQQRLEETLAPFVSSLGTELLPQVSGLFGPTAGESILGDPVLQALQQDAERKILQRQASGGRLDTRETDVALQDAFLRSGMGFLGQQRNDLLNALGMGQASAAQTGVSGVQSGANIGDLLTQIGNVQAGGIMGGQQARTQGLGNLISLGSMAFGGGGFNPFGGIGGSFGGS